MYPKFALHKLPPIALSGAIVMLGIVAVGLILHGMQTSQLGLYWDDADHFIPSMLATNGNIIQFILTDTVDAVFTQEPFSHFIWMIARAAFTISLSTLHWLSVTILILNAIVLVSIARRIVNENWYVFAVGIIFLTYPLSPLQAIWPSTLHHLWASLLALLAILFSLCGLRAIEKRRLHWFALATIAYLASLLTHAMFVLIPPAFISLYILSKEGHRGTDYQQLGRVYLYKPPLYCLSLFLAMLVMYGLWRAMVLPIYGADGYAAHKMELTPGIVTEKFLVGAHIAFVPWGDALRQVWRFPPSLPYIALAVILVGIVWIITVGFLVYSSSKNGPSFSREPPVPADRYWLRAAATGVVLVIAALAVVAVSPIEISRIIGARFGSRVNYAALIGIALGLPALPVVLARFYRRYTTLVRFYGRYTAVAALVALCCLIYIGFIRFPGGGTILSHQSTSPELFGRYSLIYGGLILTYFAAIALAAITAILSTVPRAQKIMYLYRSDNQKFILPQIRAYLLSGVIALLVLVSNLFHISIKQEFASEWSQHKTMMAQLQSIAPALEDSTFIVIVHPPSRPRSAPYATYWEVSCFLLALYDNWSIMGNTDRHLRFYADGVESTYFGRGVTWFPSGVRGPTWSHATLPLSRISYDRLLLFEFNGHTLRLLPKIEVTTEEGDRLVVHNNPKRILDRAPVRTPVWQHVTE
jgi:hypothetical protein